MKNVSISLRLTFWFSLIFLGGFVVFGCVMWLDLAYSLSKGRDRTLARRANRVMDVLESGRDDSPGRRATRFDEFADAMPEGNLIQVFDSRGKLLYPQTTALAFPWPDSSESRGERYVDRHFGGRRYRVLERPVWLSLQPVRILVAGQLEDNRQLLARFSLGLAAATPALLALSALGGYFLSRRALQPVDRLTAAVRSIGIGNLSGRLPINRSGDELERLAVTCNDMLARLESAVGRINRFTADASHELRSPISFIRTVAEYSLCNPGIDDESREGFAEILQESEEAARLLEDMLLLARADAGQATVSFARVNLPELMEEVCDKLRPLAEAKRQALIFAVKNGAAPISGDRSSLRRLLWTLLHNAIQYTPPCGRIEAAIEKEGTQAIVTVRDNGDGIPENLLPRIFERFFRVDPARSEAGGTGLGLSIAKWIADVHRASISVQSKVGEGSTFRVRFVLSE